jgi:hypothetical protein
MNLCKDCIQWTNVNDPTLPNLCAREHRAEVVQGYGCADWDDGKRVEKKVERKPNAQD